MSAATPDADRPDPFVEAYEQARSRLAAAEGRNISTREVLRRAGFSEKERAKVSYRLVSERRHTGQHRVPPEIIDRLAQVLPGSREELTEGARRAAGLGTETPQTRPSLAPITDYLRDPQVSEDDRRELLGQMAAIIAKELGPRSRVIRASVPLSERNTIFREPVACGQH